MHKSQIVLPTQMHVHTNIAASIWSISFICTYVLCQLVGVQTCASCSIVLSYRWILAHPGSSQLSFNFYSCSSASPSIQEAKAVQCSRQPKLYFQGDGTMFHCVAGVACQCSTFRLAACVQCTFIQELYYLLANVTNIVFWSIFSFPIH